LDEAMTDLRIRLGGLPSPDRAQAIWDDIWVHEAHSSTAIEGNTLVLREVAELLVEGRAVGAKPLAEYLEVQGYGEAARWVYRQAITPRLDGEDLISLTEVRYVHEMAMSKVWSVAPHSDAFEQERPGSFRRHDIRAFPGGMKPPSHALVDAKMRDWLDEANAIREASGHLIEALADIHASFERVHPFIDGNGRTGRLLVNLILVRLGYAPAIIQKRERTQYLAALRKADSEKVGPLAEILTRAVLDNINRFVIPAIATHDALVPLPSLATPEVSHIALVNAARRGRLRAQRDHSGQWQSTREWVDAYLVSRYRA